MKAVMGCILLAAPAIAWTADHSTMLREQRNVIPTIYGDLHRPMLDLPVGLVRSLGGGFVQLHGSYRQMHRDLAGADNGVGDRYQVDLTWHQSVGWRGLATTEIRVGLVFAEENDDSVAPTTLRTLALVPLLRSRYGGMTIAAGTAFGWSNRDFQESSADDWGKPGYILQLRGASAFGHLGMVQGYLGGEFWPEAVSRFAEERSDRRGDPVPAGSWSHQVIDAQAGLGYSRRFATWLRAGLVGRVQFRDWDGKDDDLGWRDWNAATSVFTEFTPYSGLHLQLAGGIDPGEFHRGMDDIWQGQASLIWTF